MFYNIPSNRDEGQFIFTGTKASVFSNENEWMAWTVPSSASYISMTIIGPGGAGGTGRAAAVGTAKGGGGGGGSGGITNAVYRTKFLPSVLFFNFGTLRTMVSVAPDNSANTYMTRIAYANGGNDGTNATGTTNGAGGAGALSNTLTGIPPFSSLALSYSHFGGQAGGGTTSDPPFMLALSYILHGGAAGGSTTTTPAYGNGGSINPSTYLVDYFPNITGGTGNSGGAGGNGANGTWFWKPHLLGLGGGGGGAGSTTPGKGGNGGYGCGGGGGGSCVTADPTSGGQGGPGLIIIKCW